MLIARNRFPGRHPEMKVRAYRRIWFPRIIKEIYYAIHIDDLPRYVRRAVGGGEGDDSARAVYDSLFVRGHVTYLYI